MLFQFAYTDSLNIKKDDKYLSLPEFFFAPLAVFGWLRPCHVNRLLTTFDWLKKALLESRPRLKY